MDELLRQCSCKVLLSAAVKRVAMVPVSGSGLAPVPFYSKRGERVEEIERDLSG